MTKNANGFMKQNNNPKTTKMEAARRRAQELREIAQERNYREGWVFHRMVEEFGRQIADQVLSPASEKNITPINDDLRIVRSYGRYGVNFVVQGLHNEVWHDVSAVRNIRNADRFDEALAALVEAVNGALPHFPGQKFGAIIANDCLRLTRQFGA